MLCSVAMERAINARPIEQDTAMTIASDNPDSDGPWYLWKSSIVMISMTIIVSFSVAVDYLDQDMTPKSDLRIVENGTIVSGGSVESRMR